jgi:hypothetical protein
MGTELQNCFHPMILAQVAQLTNVLICVHPRSSAVYFFVNNPG